VPFARQDFDGAMLRQRDQLLYEPCLWDALHPSLQGVLLAQTFFAFVVSITCS